VTATAPTAREKILAEADHAAIVDSSLRRDAAALDRAGDWEGAQILRDKADAAWRTYTFTGAYPLDDEGRRKPSQEHIPQPNPTPTTTGDETVKSKRTVVYDDQAYKVRSDTIEIPDLETMTRFAALQWLCRNTYGRGHSRPNPLAGLGAVINVVER
jgi:hypothetical protein